MVIIEGCSADPHQRSCAPQRGSAREMKNSSDTYSMRKSFALLTSALALLLGVFPAGAIIDAALQMQLGNPSGAVADPNNHNHYLIQRTVEAIDYSDNLGQPNWVSWDLTSSDLGASGRSPDFVTDTNLPSGFYEVTTTDYSGSGYDRGH